VNVGAFGYQQLTEFPFLHIGARYYDPVSGRFLLRDPIGIRGEPGAYSYVMNSPTVRVDIAGTDSVRIGVLTGQISVLEFLELLGYRITASMLASAAVIHHMTYPGLPARAEPKSTQVLDCGSGKGTIRDYDSTGRAYRDYDYGHDHGAGDPHVHDWNWSNPHPRGPGRPWGPGDGFLPF